VRPVRSASAVTNSDSINKAVDFGSIPSRAKRRHPVARPRRLPRREQSVVLLQEKLVVTNGLRKDECALDDERYNRDEHELTGRIERPGSGHGVVGKNQRHDDDGRERDQRGAHAIQTEALFTVLDAPDEQT
jgi:hypothetical protein